MGIIFRSGRPNFPKDEAELKIRLAEVEKLINNDNKVIQVNVQFAKTAFKLMEDCDLITESNIKSLCSAQFCENFDRNFKFPFNPTEGALRYVTNDNDVIGGEGNTRGPRFYSGYKRYVVELLNGDHYLISNDWYGDYSPVPNKRAFYDWLDKNATVACKAKWAEDRKNKPQAVNTTENNSEIEKLLSNLTTLVARIDSRVDNLEKVMQKIDQDIQEIKIALK